MAGKKSAGSKKRAHKKKGALKDLSRSGQELTAAQTKAVKGGGWDVSANKKI